MPKAKHASQFLFVGPSDGTPITLADIEYEATKAQMVVGAQLVEDRDGQPKLARSKG